MESYRDLIVWQRSMQLVKEVYQLTPKLPKEELFALSSQMRRSVVSIPSNIAEGYGRQSAVDYLRFLKIARGSKNELETQLDICRMLGFFSQEDSLKAIALSEEVGRMLNTLILALSEKE